MKLMSPIAPRILRSHTRHTRGFTLIELLVVIALISMLATFTVIGVQSQMKRSRLSDTGTRLKMVENLLEDFKTANGEYPEPVAWDRMGEGKFGGSYRVGGAACLYQAITGDGTSEINGFTSADGKSGSSTGEFGSTGPIYLKDFGGKKDTYVHLSGDSWIVIDTFGNPFQYRKYDKKLDAEFNNEGTFDLWSYGANKGADDSDDAQKGWKTNWN